LDLVAHDKPAAALTDLLVATGVPSATATRNDDGHGATSKPSDAACVAAVAAAPNREKKAIPMTALA
jgi:hypothetical protein